MNFFKLEHIWEVVSVKDNLLKWYKRKSHICYLPVFVFWEVWKARFASIFSNFQQKDETIYMKILSNFMEWNRVKTDKTRNICKFLVLVQEHPICFFDGEASKGACGAGFLIKSGSGEVIKGWHWN